MKHHQRPDVAVRRHVSARVEHAIERCAVERTLGDHRLAFLDVRDDGVPHVPHRAVRPRDIPPAPSLPEQRPIVGIVAPELRERQAVGRHEHAARHQARHVERAVDLVTTQARLTPLEERARLGLLVERIEEDALLRIVDGELDERRAPNVAHRDRVVEEDRARIRRPRI